MYAIKTYGQYHLCSCDYRFVCLLVFIWSSMPFEPRSGIKTYMQNSGLCLCVLCYGSSFIWKSEGQEFVCSLLQTRVYSKWTVWRKVALNHQNAYFGVLISYLVLACWGNLQLTLHLPSFHNTMTLRHKRTFDRINCAKTKQYVLCSSCRQM